MSFNFGRIFSFAGLLDAGGNTIPKVQAGSVGLGALTAVPGGSTNGVALGAMPADAVGVRFYLGASDSITFTVASAAPTGAPAVTATISGANGPSWDENLSGGQMIYVTAKTGTPAFRWY
jgi:hypothetical protein